MNKDEIAKKLKKIDQLMDEVVFVFMQTNMSYRQAEEEVFRMHTEKEILERKDSGYGLSHTYPFFLLLLLLHNG
jgi:hypothetical protein